jgi:hypothetical protein
MADKELTLPLPTNPSPKTLFRSNAVRVKNHLSAIQSQVLRESIDVALLEYQRKLAINTNEQNGGAAAMFKIKGALEFVDELLRLGEAPSQQKQSADIERINHNV